MLAGRQDVVGTVRALRDSGADFAIDTIRNPGVVRQAVDALRVAGVSGLFGLAKFGTEVSVGPLRFTSIAPFRP